MRVLLYVFILIAFISNLSFTVLYATYNPCQKSLEYPVELLLF